MLKLSLSNTFKQHKFLMLFIIIIIICSVISCNISVFEFYKFKQERFIYMDAAADFKVIFEEESQDSLKENVNKLIEKYNKDLTNIYIGSENNVRAYCFGNEYLSAGNQVSTDGEIILGTSSGIKDAAINKEVEFDGKLYNVCGIAPMRTYSEISVNDFLENYNVSEIRIRFNHIISPYKTNKVVKTLTEYFPNCSFELPNTENDYNGMLYNLRFAITIFIIASCNIIFVFGYLINKKKTIYSCFYICGYKSIQIILSTAAELISYIIMGNIIGDLIYYFLFLDKKHLSGFALSGFIIVFIIDLIISLIITIPSINISLHKKLLVEEEENV